jgi:hypothetical protein
MVMGEKDARTSMECRIPDNGAQREIRTAAIAFMPGQMQACSLWNPRAPPKRHS